MEREMKKEEIFSPTNGFNSWGWASLVMSPELFLNFPIGWQGPKLLGHLQLLF